METSWVYVDVDVDVDVGVDVDLDIDMDMDVDGGIIHPPNWTKPELRSPWEACETAMGRQHKGVVTMAAIGEGAVAPQWMVPVPPLTSLIYFKEQNSLSFSISFSFFSLLREYCPNKGF